MRELSAGGRRKLREIVRHWDDALRRVNGRDGQRSSTAATSSTVSDGRVKHGGPGTRCSIALFTRGVLARSDAGAAFQRFLLRGSSGSTESSGSLAGDLRDPLPEL